MARIRGFTLIELLVAISIIAILAAALFPVLSHARFQAHLAACRTNLRTIGQAMHNYANENSDYLPFGTEFATNKIWDDAAGDPEGLGVLWPDSLNEPSVLFCPTDSLDEADIETPKLGKPAGEANGDAYCSYTYRQHSFGQGGWRIDHPGVNSHGHPIHALALDGNAPPYGKIVHSNKAVNVLFNDAHVATFDNRANQHSILGTNPMMQYVELERIFTTLDRHHGR